jgi:peptide/nickel transport system substrate-binding protein
MIALAFAAILISSCASAGATDTLRVATQPLVNLDPAFIASDSEVLVANSVYNYLVDVDAQNQVQPRLATAWQVSDDGLTWTFDLAPDVRFHDGSPFSAEDVLWTYERLRDTDGLPTQSLYQNIANIEVLDDTHVRFELTTPNPFFLFDLSDNHALILNVGTEDADVAMNGTGPYRLAHQQSN